MATAEAVSPTPRGDAGVAAYLHRVGSDGERLVLPALGPAWCRPRAVLPHDGAHQAPPSNVAITESSSSGLTRTSRALEPSLGPTTPRLSRMSISRPGLGEADAQLALEHRGRAELRGDDELDGLHHELHVVADVVVELALGLLRRRHLLDVGRLELVLAVLDDLVDLRLGDPGALDTHRLGRAHRQEETVTLADQLLRTRLVEDDAAVAELECGEREPRRHVGLDQAGHDVDRGPLRGEHQVDAGRAGELGDADDRVLDVARRDHHQVGELVDDDEEVGVRRQRALAARRAPRPCRRAPPC